jgi:hypothetical protein
MEVVSNLLTTDSHCAGCEIFFRESRLGREVNRGDIEEYPAELKDDMLKLSELIGELKQLHDH